MPKSDYDIEGIFQEMEDYLIASMKRTLSYHVSWEESEGFSWQQWQTVKLRELKKFQKNNRKYVKSMTAKWDRGVKEVIRLQFLEGGKKTDKQFKSAIEAGYKLVRGTPNDDFFLGDSKKLKSLIKAVENDFNKAQYAALRQMDDVYRQTIFKAEMFQASGSMTAKQAVDMATKDFLAKGIDCITYRNGANVNIASYTKMALSTANKRAHLMGEGERRQQWGEYLVLMSQYSRCSPLCLPWQGRVYIDDVYGGGKASDGKYPLLSTAIKGHAFHPHCKHTLSTYFEGISTIPKPLMTVSPAKYEKAQEIAEAKRNARKYERLKNGSLDRHNIEKYSKKEKEWRNKSE